MSNANSIDVPKDGTATIGHKAILTSLIDGESWPDAIHQVVEYSQSIGIHPYLQNDIVLRSISDLENDRPVKSFFLRSQLDKQSKAEEKILTERMTTLAGRDPLWVYSLLIKSDPTAANFDFTNPDFNKLAPHSSDEANIWRSTKVIVSDYAVYKHLAGMGYKLGTPPTPDDVKLIQAHLPSRYLSQFSETGTPAEREIARELPSVDCSEADSLIAAEVKAITDYPRYVAEVPASYDTPAIPCDSDAVILTKLTDSSSSINSFNALLKVHEESISSCLKLHASVKKFVDEVIPIANHLCKELVTNQQWGAILPFIERHFTLNAQFATTTTALPIFNATTGMQAFKHLFKNFLSKVQVLEQERDSSMRVNVNKLTFAKALDVVLLLDSEWKAKYPNGPDKVTRDHKIREHLRTIFRGTDLDPVLNNLLQRESEADHKRIFAEFEHHERLHPRPSASGRKVTIHTVTTAKRAREDLPDGDSFCLLHSASGDPVRHDTKLCYAIKNGDTEEDPDGSGWHVYKSSGLLHMSSKKFKALNSAKKPKHDNGSKGGLKGGSGGGGKGGSKGNPQGGPKGGNGNPKGGDQKKKSLKQQNDDLKKQVNQLQSGSGADKPACSVCFKAYQAGNASLADISSHHTNEHSKWKKGKSEVNAVEFSEFKTQLTDMTALMKQVDAHVHTL
jgi:hypothetical protein